MECIKTQGFAADILNGVPGILRKGVEDEENTNKWIYKVCVSLAMYAGLT